MTAEIAVLNKSAVALAADSLVTVTFQSQRKTYLANKLFALSKFAPVGIMSYGSAELLGVPIETIVKAYRTSLGSRKYPTLCGYARDFLSWLGGAPSILSRSRQTDFVRNHVAGYLEVLKARVDQDVRARMTKGDGVTDARVREILEDVVSREHRELEGRAEYENLPLGFQDRIRNTYRDLIQQHTDEMVSTYEGDDRLREAIAHICVLSLCKNDDRKATSGFVVAGFGTDDAFPVLHAFSVYGIAAGTVLYSVNEVNRDGDLNQHPHPNPAMVVPFAQDDVVHTFVSGVDRRLLAVFGQYAEELFARIAIIAGTSQALQEELKAAAKNALKDLRDKISQHIKQCHSGPLINTVSVMPKEDLAVLAEDLVNLTAIKRKMSLDIETVGGPVDVALITKGDGFIWLKRKHYFEPDLNHHFFATYFRTGDTDGS